MAGIVLPLSLLSETKKRICRMTSDATQTNLLHLGVGEGSKVEHVKVTSDYLRGKIAEELQEDSSHFSDEQVNLMKFHGVYQQEDRDTRQARKAAHTEK